MVLASIEQQGDEDVFTIVVDSASRVGVGPCALTAPVVSDPDETGAPIQEAATR